ncbi:MAG: DUF4157 domain-containing protein [Nevskia sp.]|nr:DUF4157 domain-containing protein [Nevskia sp.]
MQRAGTAAAPALPHDFSRTPVHPSAAGALQAQPAIDRPGDASEREADQVAEQVVRMPQPGRKPTRAGAEPVQLQAKRAAGRSPDSDVTPAVVDEALRSPGQPLDAATRAFMEPRFDHDFSRIRVHADSRAAASADAVRAQAYTVGNDIVFAAGSYAPFSPDGQRLLAHELTHSVQQASAPALQRKPAIGQPEIEMPPDPVGAQRATAINELAASPNELAFAAASVAFIRNAPDKTPHEFANFLVDAGNRQLVAAGVPEVGFHLGKLSSDTAAQFQPDGWTVVVALDAIAPRPLKTVKDLTYAEASELTQSVYHECRHAEQTFRVGQFIRNKENKDAKQIAADGALNIPLPIAEKAVASAGSLPTDAASTAKFEDWRAMTRGGRHFDYKAFVVTLQSDFLKYIDLRPPITDHPDVAERAKFDAWAAAVVDRVPYWKQTFRAFMDDKIRAVEAIAKPTEFDKSVKQGLRSFAGEMPALFYAAKTWSEQHDKKDAEPDALRLAELELVSKLLGNYLAMEDAYKHFSLEADAYKVGEAVGNDMATVYTMSGGMAIPRPP